jgi:hypothetical protein
MIIGTTGGFSPDDIYSPDVVQFYIVETEPDSVSEAESEGISLDTLESHLWGAVDILRGSISSVNYSDHRLAVIVLNSNYRASLSASN